MNRHEGVGHDYEASPLAPKRSYHCFDFGIAADMGRDRFGGQRFDSGYWRRSDGSGAQAFKFRNPFAFWTVISFALFFGAVIVVGRLVGEWLGGVGAIVGAASGANREFKRAIRV